MIFEKERIETVCYQTILEKWQASINTFPNFLTPVSAEDQRKNEYFLSHHIQKFQKLLKTYKNPCIPKFLWRKRWNALINSLLFKEPVIGIADTFSAETLNDMQHEFYQFFQSASAFDEVMGMEEIGQAARNYLVYDVFTEIHELPHTMNPAILGYSMLYPYTDNYIDNPALSFEEKERYNQMIADRIIGKPIDIQDKYYQKTCDLLDSVTHFYEKEEKSDIQTGLLFMLDAQKKSLSQTRHEGQTLLTEDEIFRISSYKGGISVLIDRFYVPSKITPEDFIFYLSYGFFLQLADDLQDITEDRNTMRQTLFTIGSLDSNDTTKAKKHHEETLNKLFHYLHTTMNEYPMHSIKLKSFIEKNCYLLLIYSAYLSGENFSPKYLQQFIPYMPVSLPFIQNIKETFAPYITDPALKNIISDGMNTSDIQFQNKSYARQT